MVELVYQLKGSLIHNYEMTNNQLTKTVITSRLTVTNNDQAKLWLLAYGNYILLSAIHHKKDLLSHMKLPNPTKSKKEQNKYEKWFHQRKYWIDALREAKF